MSLLRDKITERGGILSLAKDVHMTAVGHSPRDAELQAQDVDLLQRALGSWEFLPEASTSWNNAVRRLVEIAVGEAKVRHG